MSVNYETVPSPNYAAYANPGFGAALGQMLQGLPDQYMKGRENSRKIEAEDAFRNGYPKNPDGSPDVNSIMDKGLKVGGLPYAQGLMQWLQTKDLLRNTSGDLSEGAPQVGAPPVRPAPVSSAAGPANVGTQPPQPQLSSAGADNKGDQTINSLASEVFGDRDMTAALPRYAAAVGNKLGEPLTADQEQRARVLMQRSKGAMASAAPGDTTATPGAGGSGPQNSANAAPFMGGGASRAPAPSAGHGAPPAQVAQAQPGSGTGLPAGFDQATSQRLHAAAAAIMEKGKSLAILKNPELSKSYQERASQLEARANKIDEALAKDAELSGPAKEARESGVVGGPMAMEGLKVAQKQELTRGDALQKGLQGAAREFETALKPHLDAMRGILNDPNFVSGTGVGFQEALNKIRSNPLFQGLPGYDPNAALPNEAIRKVVAASILNQTTELKAEAAEMGGSAGRLFQQQISLMEKAAQNPENTAPALRYLTEMQQRMGDHSRAIAELASNYQGKYGRGVLDNGFNEVLSKYNNEHPIFKQSEIKDPRLFAPPTAPALNTKDEAVAWARKVGLRPGDPMKLPSGKIVAAP